MAQQTRTAQRPQQQTPQAPTSKGEVAIIPKPRLLPPEAVLKEYGVSEAGWRTLVDAIFPAAKSAEAVIMALEYCAKRKFDIFKRPVHIVPVYSSIHKRMIETVWPGIAELRTTAMRTGEYAGMDKPVFGPKIKREFRGEYSYKNDRGDWEKETLPPITVEFPEWCEITVYRLLKGNRVPFPGPRVEWMETFAYIRNGVVYPNAMWQKRSTGQLEKCTEAASLRRAFPEELGNEYSVDEAEAFHTHEARDVTQEGHATVGGEPTAEPKRTDPKYQQDVATNPSSKSDAKVSPTAASPDGQASETGQASQGAAGGKAEAAAGQPEPTEVPEANVTDVVDLNEQPEDSIPTEPEPITFEKYSRFGDFIDFSSKWLGEPGRTPAHAEQWHEFYKDALKAGAQHNITRIKEGVADLLVQYGEIMGRDSA